MQVLNDQIPGEDQWTTWGQPAEAKAGGRKVAAVLIPVGVLLFIGLAAIAFVLLAGPAGAVAGCGGG